MSPCCCPPREDGELQIDTPQQKLLHRRKCTDCCCLLLMLLAVGGAWLVAQAAFEVGNPGLLTHGKDYTGKLCGVDNGVLDKPKVYYPRLAKDLIEYQQHGSIQGTPTSLIPIYAVCVAACPAAGDTVKDDGCQGWRRHPGCKFEVNPFLPGDEFGAWRVGVGTRDVVNRCVPYVEADTSNLELCAVPDCHAADKPCYTESFEEENYWRLRTADERANCLRSVDLSMSRTFTMPDSGPVDTFVGQSVGGLFGAASDVSRALLEVLVFGVLACIVVNLVALILLRYAIRCLFYVAVLGLVGLLIAIDVALFSKAGELDLRDATNATLGAVAAGSTWAYNLVEGLDEAHVDVLEQHADLVDGIVDAAEQAEGRTASALASVQSSLAASISSQSVLDVAAVELRHNYQIGACVSTGITVLLLVFVCALLSRLERSLEICARATEAVFFMPGLVALPLVSMLISLAAIAFFVVVACYLTTPDPVLIVEKINELTLLVTTVATDVTNQGLRTVADAVAHGLDAVDSSGAVDAAVELDVPTDLEAPVLAIDSSFSPKLVQTIAIVYELFVSLWVLSFFDAIVYTTIASAVGYWYFVESQPDDDGDGDIDGDGVRDKSSWPLVSSLCRIVRYHLGTMAIGSFVLAAIQLVRIFMVWLDEQMKQQGFRDSLVVQLAMKCIHCLLWCFEQSIKFLTRFTYVFVALEGLPFCPSAVQTFRLISKYPMQMLANEAARAVLTLVQTMFPPLACSWLAYLAVVHQWRDCIHSVLFSSVDALNEGASQLAANEAIAPYVDGHVPALATGWIAFDTWRDGPPAALPVALAVLALAYYITASFTIVYGAAIDTLFVCMFRDEQFFEGRYSRRAHAASSKAFLEVERPNDPASVPMATESREHIMMRAGQSRVMSDVI